MSTQRFALKPAQLGIAIHSTSSALVVKHANLLIGSPSWTTPKQIEQTSIYRVKSSPDCIGTAMRGGIGGVWQYMRGI